MAFSDYVSQLMALREGLAARGLPTPSLPPLPATRPGPADSPSMPGLSPDEAWIIQRESSGRTTAKNPKSSAFGLGQLIRSNRERYARQFGFSPDTTDYGQQLRMFREYVADRYGDATKARQFWQRNRWY